MAITSTKQKTAEVAAFLQAALSDRRVLTALKILLASCFIGICAQIKIPLYFTPVPLTIQTAGVMLAGALLGSRHGALAALCYLIQGCIGLPVWAGGASGLAHFMGPTGGYLMAYIVQAYLIGWFLERQNTPKLVTIMGALFLSIVIQMGIGSIWLAQFVGLGNCLALGFFPFLFTEMAKASLLGVYLRARKK